MASNTIYYNHSTTAYRLNSSVNSAEAELKKFTEQMKKFREELSKPKIEGFTSLHELGRDRIFPW